MRGLPVGGSSRPRPSPSAPGRWYAVGLLVVVCVLTGCLGSDSAPEPGETQAPSFEGLDAPGAQSTEDGDQTRTFRFEGTLQEAAQGEAVFAFEVDERVGSVEVLLSSQASDIGSNGAAKSGIEVDLLDSWGREQCQAAGGALREGCSAPVPGNVSSVVNWSIEANVGGTGSLEDERFAVEAVLHPPEHIRHGDPLAGTENASAFQAANTGAASSPGFEEPSIGTLGDGSVFVQAGLNVLKSTDRGRSWQDVTPTTHAPSTLDPMLATEPTSGTVFSNHLTIECTWLAWSRDQGDSWETNPHACSVPGTDHQKIEATVPSVPGTDLPTVYLGYSSPGSPEPAVWMARSLDGGRSFPTSTPVAGPSTGHEPRNTGPMAAQGSHVIMPLVLCGDGGSMAVAASQDAGLSFDVHVVDEEERSCAGWGSDMGPAVDTEGTFYVAYQRPSGLKYVFSTDGGQSWSDPVDVPMDDRGAVIHPAAVAGDPGRLAVTYRATPDADGPPDYVPGWAAWHQYVTVVTNATTDRPTFHTYLVNEPDDPIRRGPLCTGWGAVGYCPGETRMLLDFIDVAVGPGGSVYPAYSDACQAPCPTPADSRDVELFVGVQQNGTLLYEDRAPWADTAS